MRAPKLVIGVLLLPALASPQASPQPEPASDLRPALRRFGQALDRAVANAAPPSPLAMLAGPGGSHGYHLRGQGLFFVLPPRRLPMRGPRMLMIAPPGAVMLRGAQGRELAERVAALQAESERMHREAERAYREVRREIHVRFEVGPGEHAEAGDGPPAEPDAGSDDEPHPEPPLPPWHFWFESDARPPDPAAGQDEMVAQVRSALTGVLEKEGGVLPALGPEEFVAVAVDFVSDPFFASEDARDRTLVVRVSYRDIRARLEGGLSAEQFRERIAYEEY